MPRPPQTDTVQLGDGRTMQVTRPPDLDQGTWDNTKRFLESNPELASQTQGLERNPDRMRGMLQTQAISEHYKARLRDGDDKVRTQFAALEQDEELRHMFEDIKRNGIEVAVRYWNDESLMLKICQRIGGPPPDLQAELREIDETPLTLHEASRYGNLEAVASFLRQNIPIDGQDIKGITPLGYAIQADRFEVVKALLHSRSNLYSVDANGCSALHYAAGYGREGLVEYLLQAKANVNQQNRQGQTPFALGQINGHQACIDIMQKYCAQR